MAFFRLETMSEGRIIDSRHIEISVNTVDEALKHPTVIKFKHKARNEGFGFRVKREDE